MRPRLHYEIYPAGFLPVLGVSAAGHCCWYDSRRSFDTVIAHDRHDIVGALTFSRSRAGLVTVHAIWVVARWRRRGVGRQMLDLLAPARLRAEVISDAGLAFFSGAARCPTRIRDGRQLALWPFGC